MREGMGGEGRGRKGEGRGRTGKGRKRGWVEGMGRREGKRGGRREGDGMGKEGKGKKPPFKMSAYGPGNVCVITSLFQFFPESQYTNQDFALSIEVKHLTV